MPGNLLSGIHVLNTVDPGLKIAGVTREWESKFCFFFGFKYLWTIRTIRGQAKNSLKIAGVTGQGVIASSWFRLRGNPKFLTLSNLLFSF